jgi:hypothetical protein
MGSNVSSSSPSPFNKLKNLRLSYRENLNDGRSKLLLVSHGKVCCKCSTSMTNFPHTFLLYEGMLCYCCYRLVRLRLLTDKWYILQCLIPEKDISRHIITLLINVMPIEVIVLCAEAVPDVSKRYNIVVRRMNYVVGITVIMRRRVDQEDSYEMTPII